MRAEFTEDKEIADADKVSGRLRKEKSTRLVFVWGLGAFMEDEDLVYVPPRHPGNLGEHLRLSDQERWDTTLGWIKCNYPYGPTCKDWV